MTVERVWDITVDSASYAVAFGAHILLVAEEWPGWRMELRSAADGSLTRVVGTNERLDWVCECEGGGLVLGYVEDYPPGWEYQDDYERSFTARHVDVDLQLGDPIEIGRTTMVFDPDRWEHLPTGGTFIAVPDGLTFTGAPPRMSQTVDGRVTFVAAFTDGTLRAVTLDADLTAEYSGFVTAPGATPGPMVAGTVAAASYDDGTSTWELMGLGPSGRGLYRQNNTAALRDLPVWDATEDASPRHDAALTPQSFNTRLCQLGAPYLHATHDWGSGVATFTFGLVTPTALDKVSWTVAASETPWQYWTDLLATGRDVIVLYSLGSGSGDPALRLAKFTSPPPVLTADFDGSRVHFIG